MEKFNTKHLENIQTIFEDKTGVNIKSKHNYVNRNAKQLVVLATMLVCFLSLSAFAYGKFSSLEGDEVGFYPRYMGDGVFEITITNSSNKDLKLQEQIKLMRWSTGEEIEGDKDKIAFSNMTIAAFCTDTIVIDLSKAYDIATLEKSLPDGDNYYLILTNNNFAFGQDWMCSIDFDENVFYEPKDTEKAEERKEEKEEIVFEAILVYEDWCWPTESQKVSNPYGENENGTESDHINIAGELGDKVYAVANGTVIETGFDVNIGNYIILDLGNNITIKYGHLSEISVEEGDSVKQGKKIGELGKTGMATGYNLYFAVYESGETVNPLAR